MIKVERCLKDDRLMRATTGLSIEKFERLAEDFKESLKKDAQERYQQRKESDSKARHPGGGRKGNVKTYQEKLFFILLYFKCYPTFDFLGLLFDLARKNAKARVDNLTPILEKTLKRKMVLPKRKISSLEEFLEVFPEAQDLFPDGTERPYHRKKEGQKKFYSGKKKRHTTKNFVIGDENKKINYLSPTVYGKEHDLTIFRENFDPKTIPKEITLWFDLAFLGVDKYFPNLSFVMPKKKPKGKELSKKEKESNKIISGIRVLSENAICGVKRFRITADIFRNKSLEFNDTVMFLSCGLWNYYLEKC